MSAASGLQDLIVFVCVSLAAIYALLRWVPKLSISLQTLLAQGLERFGWPAMSIRLRERAKSSAGCGSGCGSCGSCGTTSKSASPPVSPVEKTVQFHRPR